MIKLLSLPKILDERGNLKIKRVYWIYDVPGGEFRGSHAFKESEEFIVAMSGSFDVILHNGIEEKKFFLNRSYYGLYIPKLTWRKLENFSTNSLALVIASKEYNDREYIRDFNQFLSFMT
jgi:hypothetical protein